MSRKKQARISLLTIFSMTMSLLAGHPQTSIYVMITVIGYYIYRNIRKIKNITKFTLFLVSCFLFLIPLLLASSQIFPSIQVYSESARNLVDSRSWAKAFLIKPAGLITLIAPDFFGNPVTRNSWSDFSYVEMQGYIGIIGLILAIASLKRPTLGSPRPDLFKFFVFLILTSMIVAIDSPISRFLINLKIPIISDSSPGRIMGLIDFSLAVLAAFGLDSLIELISKKKIKHFNSGIYFIAAIMAGLWLWTFISTNPNVLVARRNLIFPSTIFTVFSMAYFMISKISANLRAQALFLVSCSLLLVSLDLFRFHHKFIPFSDVKNWYPEVPVITQLKSSSGRIFGTLEANLNLPFRLKSIDGYDPLINRKLVLLTYSPEALLMHNRITSPDLPKGNSKMISRLGELGVKRVIDYAVPGGNSWDFRLWEYGDQFRLEWKDVKYQILYNTQAQESEVEPIGGMKNSQLKLFNLGVFISGATVFGMILWRKKYV